MEKSNIPKDIIGHLVGIAGEGEELPPQIREKMQAKKHQITPKYEVAGRQANSVFNNMLEYYEEAGAKFRKVEVK